VNAIQLHADRAVSRTALLITVVAIAATGATVATASSAVHAVRAHPLQAATFLALTLVFQLLTVEVYGKGRIGIAAIAKLAAGFALGPGVAVGAALATALAQYVRGRGLVNRAIFDASNLALSAASATVVFQLLARNESAVVELGAATVAGAIYTGVNNSLLCLAMAISESTPFRAVWRERFHWARFHFLGYGPLALALTLAYERVGIEGLVAFALPPVLTAISVRQYLQHTRDAVEEVRAANEEMRRAHRDTIAALTRSISAKDDYTGGHTERVAEVAVALGRRLGYRGDDLEAIEIGALLHDIGKIGVPEAVLSKPGPLDESEWAKMKEHPVISDFILSGTALHPFVRQIARWSHERYDGAGYPDGLAGEEIPLPARIVFVADSFDAVTSDRPYRRARAVGDAIAELRRCAGTQFCPTVVAALDAALDAELRTPRLALAPVAA
jgi:hypothetical protein